MISTIASAPQAPTPAPKQPTTPDLEALRTQFGGIAAKLKADDEVLTSMVAKRNPVGAGWAPHLSTLSADLLAARDALLAAKPEVASDLGGKLGVDQRKLAEAAGSFAVFARQQASLAEAWSSYLDTAIANAEAAVELLKPVDPPKPADPPKVVALAGAAPGPQGPTYSPGRDGVSAPGDIDYCRTPGHPGRSLPA